VKVDPESSPPLQARRQFSASRHRTFSSVGLADEIEIGDLIADEKTKKARRR
jgi:hypothetical protein